MGKLPYNDIGFPFGIDSSGNYGYYKAGADTVTPFKVGSPDYTTVQTIYNSTLGRGSATYADADLANSMHIIAGSLSNDNRQYRAGLVVYYKGQLFVNIHNSESMSVTLSGNTLTVVNGVSSQLFMQLVWVRLS